jgi:hypothetical protein
MIALGVGGTGSSSAILMASDPVAQMEAMVVAMRRAWDARSATAGARSTASSHPNEPDPSPTSPAAGG